MGNAHSSAVIDHLVFGCDHLQNGTSYIEKTLNVGFSGGGKHSLMATHNRLLNYKTASISKSSLLIMRSSKKMGILFTNGGFHLMMIAQNKGWLSHRGH